MKLIVNNQVIERLKEEFPYLSKTKYGNKKDTEPLKAYFKHCEEEIKYIMSIESLKSDENLHDFDFFGRLFELLSIILDEEDLTKYLNEIFDGNYKIEVVNTTIPNQKYDIKDEKIVYTLKQALFAIKNCFDIDPNHVYSPSDIVMLQNQNLMRYLEILDDYKTISGQEFFILNKEYKKSNIIPMNVDIINKFNYLKLLNNYPYLFSFIRKNISFDMLNDLLYNYEQLVSDIINQEIESCNVKVDQSLKRIDDIKKLTLRF